MSARGDYAVRAALGLAAVYPATATACALAGSQGMPRKFLEVVLSELRRAGLVRGLRGSEGGYVLTRSPADISIGEVLRAVDGPLACVRGMPPEEAVYDGAATHLGQLWVATGAAVRGVLEQVSLADVVRGQFPPHVRRLGAVAGSGEPR